MRKSTTEFTTAIPFWSPSVTPVELDGTTEEQLYAMKFTPSNNGVLEYVLPAQETGDQCCRFSDERPLQVGKRAAVLFRMSDCVYVALRLPGTIMSPLTAHQEW